MAVENLQGELQRVRKTLDLQESLVNGCDQELSHCSGGRVSLSFHYYRLDNRTDIDSHGFRLGLGTNSPPQFGQTLFISAAHCSQKVHSYEQITAMPFGSSS
jgi:hypothetical protein